MKKEQIFAMRIMTCSCESRYQDEKFGLFKRFFNKMVKDQMWRCTVCGKEKTS